MFSSNIRIRRRLLFPCLPYITGMLKTIAITHYRGHKNDAGVTVSPEYASEKGENAKGNEPNWESSWEPEVQEVPFLKRIPFKWVQRTLTSRPPSPRLAPSASLIKLFASTARYPKGIVDIGTFQSVPKGNCGGLPLRLVKKLSGLWRLCNAFVPEKKPAAFFTADELPQNDDELAALYDMMQNEDF